MRVRWKKTASTATRTAAVMAAVISSLFTCTPATVNDVSGMPTSSFLTFDPQSSSPKPSRKKLRPMVAMNRMMYSWLTSGRNTTRSMAKASAVITAIVSTRASSTGTPRSMSPTSVSAAKSTITPWAKLKTPEALKMSTKPRATSEYMRPAATPPISTSIRKPGAPAMSRNGPTKTPYRISMRTLPRLPEIGPDHGRVGAHVGGAALGDLLAVVQHHDMARDVHDHPHVVLDQDDGRPPLVVDVQEVDDPLDERPVLHLLLHRWPPVQGVEEDIALHLQEPAGHDVVEHAHAPEQGHVLEGPRDAELGDLVRLEVRPVRSL